MAGAEERAGEGAGEAGTEAGTEEVTGSLAQEGRRNARKADCGSVQQNVGRVRMIVVTDADYRSITLPCDALEESEGPPGGGGPAAVSRVRGR